MYKKNFTMNIQEGFLQTIPLSHEIDLKHYQQKSSWDCGISCVAMVLNTKNRKFLLDNLENICQEEGFQSTWTIDLCYLLKRFNVHHFMSTTMLGVNPEYEHEEFYGHILVRDEKRINEKFSKAALDKDPLIIEGSITHQNILLHLAKIGPIILLVDSSLLKCNICNINSKTNIHQRNSYMGHYIILVGYNLSKRKYLYRNPSWDDCICIASFSCIDKARKAYGTDEDAIFIKI